MSNSLEQQAEEREALQSIYEGDAAFTEINPTTFQYKYGKDDNEKSFLVEIHWSEQYPNKKPGINMDAFYNRNLSLELKQKIRTILLEEAENWLGCGMTYTLFECLKDRLDFSVSYQSDILEENSTNPLQNEILTLQTSNIINSNKKESKKEQLSKAQKRRQWDRVGINGDRPRGWNWVDIIKHLSQTSQKEENNPSPNITTLS